MRLFASLKCTNLSFMNRRTSMLLQLVKNISIVVYVMYTCGKCEISTTRHCRKIILFMTILNIPRNAMFHMLCENNRYLRKY